MNAHRRLLLLFTATSLSLSPALSHGAVPGGERGEVLVVNQGDRTLVAIDPSNGQTIQKIPVGGVTGHEVALLPDARAAVPIYGNAGVGKPGTDGDSISVIDLRKGTIAGKIELGHGVRPHCPRYDPHTGMLYVTTELDKTISIIDPHTLRVVGTVPTGEPESHMLVLTRDGRKAYTANVHSGTISVLDLPKRKVIKVIPVSSETQRIALSVDDKYVFTSDQVKPRLAVINTVTNALAEPIPLPAIGYGITPTPDGRWLLVALRTQGQVAVVDLQSRKVAKVLSVPGGPTEILVRPDGQVAYVSCGQAGQVAAIDTHTWTVAGTWNAGNGADGLAWVPPSTPH